MKKLEHLSVERHPFPPFIPANARLLMLGSFPPPAKRWSIDFYYPNMQNDMWRIFGLIFFSDREYFVDREAKAFRKQLLISFLQGKGIALYDTAAAVRRLQDNASDKFLEVAEPADIPALLNRIPQCGAIVTTGQKATDTIIGQLAPLTVAGCIDQPDVGGFSSFTLKGLWGNKERSLRLYRMPSSSRAYPLALEKKADFYGKMFLDLDMM